MSKAEFKIFFDQKSWLKIFTNAIYVKHRKFRFEILSKIEILSKNQNFNQKSIFCTKIEILIKNPYIVQYICTQKSNFSQKSKF